MAQVTPEILARCLDDLAAGRSRLDEYVPRDPMIAADLQSLVEIVQSIAPPPPVSLDVATQARLRAGLIRGIAQVQRLDRESWSQRLVRALWNGRGRRRVVPVRIERLPALVAAGVIVLTTTFGGGVVFASEGTIPGDTLYSVKLTVEDVQLALAPNDEARAEVLVNSADRRLAEIAKATDTERSESARIAADSYAREVVEAGRLLGDAASRGQDVTVVAGRVSADLARQQGALVTVEQSAPAEEKSALARADESLKSGLNVARDHSGDVAKQAASSETRSAVSAASRPTATNLLATTSDEEGNSAESTQARDTSGAAAVALPSPTPTLTAVPQPVVQPTDTAEDDGSSGKPGSTPTAVVQPSATENPTDTPDSAIGQPTQEPIQTPRPPTKNPSSTPVPRNPDDGHKSPPTPVPTATSRPMPKPTRAPIESDHPDHPDHPPPDDDHQAARTPAANPARAER